MPQGIEAPASTTAEGPTSHTQNPVEQPERRRGELSRAQIGYLLRGIDEMRVGKDGKGFSHVEAWDIRRHLIRVFGFGGHDTDMLEASLISETSAMRQKMGKNGPYGDPYEAWTVIYRVAVRLSVKVDGVELGHWHGIATGDASNQPSRADAHDLALKTADSQALKRAATNLGDQFGLSLYNKGSFAPVVQGSLAYLKPRTEQEFKDGKVEPEPDVAAAQNTEPSTPVPAAEAPAAGESELEGFQRRVRNGWNSLSATEMALAEAKEKGINDVIPFEGDYLHVQDVLEIRIKALQEKAAQGGVERSAA